MITKTMLNMLREDINNALISVGETHDMQLHAGNMSYDETHVNIKLAGSIMVNGEVQLKEKKDFETYCEEYDLKKTDLGRQFQSRGKTYTITGLFPKRHKNPIGCTRLDGKKYIFPAETVKALLAYSNGV